MLFDTDMLIHLFRGSEKAARLIEATDPSQRRISVVTYMELLQGARDKQELRVIQTFLAEMEFQLVPLTENIGHRASIYMEEYGLKAGMCMADALLAATAVENKLLLCTGNQKHYKVVEDLEVTVFRF